MILHKLVGKYQISALKAYSRQHTTKNWNGHDMLIKFAKSSIYNYWSTLPMAQSQKKVKGISKPSREHVLFVCLSLVSTGKDLGPAPRRK